MTDSNETSGQSQEPLPDFRNEFQKAQVTGDYDFVLDTARKSYGMLVDFKKAIEEATIPGRDSTAVAMGLNFLTNMIAQASGQVQAFKRAEKESKEAIKASSKAPTPPEAA